MNITGHTVEKLIDPFGLLTGDRYEFFLDIDVDEDDELFSEKGVGIKVIFAVENNVQKISHYHFFEKGSEKVLDFALENDEELLIKTYCSQHINE